MSTTRHEAAGRCESSAPLDGQVGRPQVCGPAHDPNTGWVVDRREHYGWDTGRSATVAPASESPPGPWAFPQQGIVVVVLSNEVRDVDELAGELVRAAST
jgi:hypothetical protein